MVKSGVPLKYNGRRRTIVLLLAILVALALTVGPSLALNILLPKAAAQNGLILSFAQARAGFLFHSLSLKKVELQNSSERLSFDQLNVDDISLLNLISLIRDPEAFHDSALPLAGQFSLEQLNYQGQPGKLDLSVLRGRALALAPSQAEWKLGPALFERLEVRDLALSSPSADLTLDRLEGRNLSVSSLAGLNLRGLNLISKAKDAPQQLTVDGLSLGGFKNEVWLRALSGGEKGLPPLWVLNICDSLDLAGAVWIIDQDEALDLPSVRFDVDALGSGHNNYKRQARFKADLQKLPPLSEPLWGDLKDIFGQIVEGEIQLEMAYHSQKERVRLTELNLDVTGQGRLTLSGELDGVAAVKSHFSSSQIMFGANTWRLVSAEANFQNRGFMSNLYRHMDRTIFLHSGASPTSDKLMISYIEPWATDVENEANVENLPAILTETEEFLKHPVNLRLRVNPETPLSLVALANLNRYDIIEKLRLSAQVNDRAPVAVAIGSGFFYGRASKSAEPMENAFTEWDLPAPSLQP